MSDSGGHGHHQKRRFISRREFWMQAGMGIGGLALFNLLDRDKLLAAGVETNCAAPKDVNSPWKDTGSSLHAARRRSMASSIRRPRSSKL